MFPLRIGTRGSPLALWQANFVADLLRPLVAPRPVELVRIQTTGDQVRDRPLSQIGGDGLFTKEIQWAVLASTVDVAVHSLKDLPTASEDGLVLAAVPTRGPAGDVLVSRRHRSFDELPPGAVVGTSSLRRRAQALHRRPDLNLVPLRGNVETRLRKLADDNLDALILAQAGLQRLRLAKEVTEVLDCSWMLPAVGQGALGLECRGEDTPTLTLLTRLDDPDTRAAVLAERAFLRTLGGGCLVPVGAESRVSGSQLRLRGAVLTPDGRERLADEVSGAKSEHETLGERLARLLLDQGAEPILTVARR